MSKGSHLFVTAVYGLIALSFFATTAALIFEFRDLDWFSLATFYSHLFIFFPVFGTVAVLAFYMPSVAFVDMYWNHIPHGRKRFCIGAVAILVASVAITWAFVSSPQRSIWEVSPRQLARDGGEPSNCTGVSAPCERLSVLQALQSVRVISKQRTGLSELVRNCEPDLLVEDVIGADKRRFCFASTAYTQSPRLTTDAECCRAQKKFVRAINDMAERSPSMTRLVHLVTLPLKVFFLLTLLVISMMLALRRKRLEKHYEPYLTAIEKGVLVGAVAMLFYPVMNHAFLQSAAMLYGGIGGSAYRGPAPYLSAIFGTWALILVFFFYRRRDKEVETVARIVGVLASAIAILRYDAIVSSFVKLAGSGADVMNILLLVVIAGVAVVALFARTTDALFAGSAVGATVVLEAAAGADSGGAN
jgi:hypothetical protein